MLQALFHASDECISLFLARLVLTHLDSDPAIAKIVLFMAKKKKYSRSALCHLLIWLGQASAVAMAVAVGCRAI